MVRGVKLTCIAVKNTQSNNYSLKYNVFLHVLANVDIEIAWSVCSTSRVGII